MTAPAATAPTNALQVQEAEGVTYNLDNWPVERFNRLIPEQTIVMSSDLVVPVIHVVQLDVQRDTYKSPDVPEGSRALTRVALRKFAMVARISIIDQRRTDDGSDPNVCEVTCVAEMPMPIGPPLRAFGVKRVDLGRQKWASDAQRGKYASFFQEQVASRAENRAIRALLNLQSSYPTTELARPFALVTYGPNMQHPEVRALFLAAMAPAVQQLYGPDQAKQLASGDAFTVVHEAPDDEPDDRDVDVATGEIKEDPAWFDAAPAASAPTLQDRLASGAKISKLKGPATAEQRMALSGTLHGTGKGNAEAITAALWDFTNTVEISAAQAQAVLGAAGVDPDMFRDQTEAIIEAAKAEGISPAAKARAAIDAAGVDLAPFHEQWLALGAKVAD